MTDFASNDHPYDSIIFDIDGTLWNAAQSTAVAWTETFEKFKIPRKISKKDIEGVAGRPYLDCLKMLFNEFDEFDQKDALLAALTRAEKESMLKMGGELYPGVHAELAKLAKKYPLYLVSNCQDWYLDAFLNFENLGKFFKDSTCFGKTRLPKDQNLKLIVSKNQLKKPVYIGDTSGDGRAAQAAGMDFIFVSYGFEPNVPAKWCARSLAELSDHLLS